jgi:hypothetical protein
MRYQTNASSIAKGAGMFDVFIGLLLAVACRRWQELAAIGIVALIVCRSSKLDWMSSILIGMVIIVLATIAILVAALNAGFR